MTVAPAHTMLFKLTPDGKELSVSASEIGEAVRIAFLLRQRIAPWRGFDATGTNVNWDEIGSVVMHELESMK